MKNLTTNKEYVNQVLPFIKTSYFSVNAEKALLKEILDFVKKFNDLPTRNILENEVSKYGNEDICKSTQHLIADIFEMNSESNSDWLLSETEKFCQEKAIYEAMTESLSILNGESKKLDKGAIPGLLSDALAVTFDPTVGHDYLEEALSRYEFYHKKDERIPCDLEILNKIMKGGPARKTLNMLLAGCVHPSTKVKVRFRKT